MATMIHDDSRLLIAGGGIGGLSAALALSAVGLPVRVLEQADAFREIGAGLQIGPNAFRVFDRLGVTDAVSEIATFPQAMAVVDALDGSTITSLPLGETFIQRFGYPYGLMHRADLHGILLEACRARPQSIDLRTGSRIASFDDDGKRVRVQTAAGEQFEGAALVGADGLWSVVRQALVADGEPRLAGHVCYRAIVPAETIPEALKANSMALWVGPRLHMVLWPMRKDRYYNVTVVFHSDRLDTGWDAAGNSEPMLEHFACTWQPVREMLAEISDWRTYVMRDREPVRDWSRGRVTLLGDAAHPMLQYLAQGACMAMEDAVCLADCASESQDDYQQAFIAYQQKRYLRTTRVQLTARLYGHVYHAEGASADLRNAFLQSRSAEQTFDSMAWIYQAQ
jgi:2-polyprenyl-6-methoxyphenol hydroxylase-like FAD-dependent oxidoreductase